MGTFKFSDKTKIGTLDKNSKIWCESAGTPDDWQYTNVEQIAPLVKTELADDFEAYKPLYFAGGVFSGVGTDDLELETDLFCRDSTDTINIELSSGFVKEIDVAFSAGKGGGALDTGSLTAFYLYSIYAIAKADGTADILVSKTGTTAALPSGYAYKREVGRFWVGRALSIGIIFNYNQIKFSENGLPNFLPQDYFAGFCMIQYSSNEFEIYKGAAKCEDNLYDLIYDDPAVSTAKTITSTWARGEGGILDTGTIADDTNYYIFAIGSTKYGYMDFLMSTNKTSPTMPTNYDVKKLIGYLYTGDYSGSDEFWVHCLISKPFTAAYLSASYDLTYAAEDTYEPILGTFINEQINQFTITSTPSIKYIGEKTALFKIDINAVIKGDTLNEDIYICIIKNPSGTPVTLSNYEMYQRVKTTNSPYIFSQTIALVLETDDEVQLVSKSTNKGAVTTFEKFVAVIYEPE